MLDALPPYVPGRRARSANTGALASNESHHAPVPSVLAAIADAAARVNRYPDPTGEELRSRIADRAGVTLDEVALGPGSVGVLQQIVTSLCGPGDEVVYAWRSFEAYPMLVTMAGARAVPVPLTADEAHDLDAIAAAVTPRTRLVLLCTPNNPTGVTLRHDAVDDFLRRIPRDVLVVIDEAYIEYDDDPDSVDGLALFAAHPHVALLRTFSKAHGLAGLRVGYALAHPPIADALRRTALPFAVTTLAQRAAIASLEAQSEVDARVAEVVAERTRVTDRLRAAGWELPDSRANFVWLRADADLHRALLDAFDAADLVVRGYAGDGVRVTLADPATNDRILAALDGITR